MIDKAIDEISFADLTNLHANAVRESRTLEYKRESSHSARDERKELRADLTALANTAGGDVLFGVVEDHGEPVAFPGILIDSWDTLENQLLSIIASGTEPGWRGVSFHRIAVESSHYVLLARVPRSYRRPHRVVIGGHGHFYGRDSSQKYRLDVEDLRRAFTETPPYLTLRSGSDSNGRRLPSEMGVIGP